MKGDALELSLGDDDGITDGTILGSLFGLHVGVSKGTRVVVAVGAKLGLSVTPSVG